jgi:hypothetical protein
VDKARVAEPGFSCNCCFRGTNGIREFQEGFIRELRELREFFWGSPKL